MINLQDTLFLYAESAIHAGMGSGLGAVDMPVQRERTTNYPMIQSSGVKGALRNLSDGKHGEAVSKKIFGEQETAGAISPGDARILLFPVRSLKGVFVWITCPYVLARYMRDTKGNNNLSIPEMNKDDEALVASESIIVDRGQIMLEEFAYSARAEKETQKWAQYFANQVIPRSDGYAHFRERVQTHFVLLPDDDFRDFVTYSTEIVTRIKIDNATKTVEKGALFTQELLPADTILYSPVEIMKARGNGSMKDTDVQSHLHKLPTRFQIGGDETLGRGLVHTRWLGENNDG